MIVPTVTEKCFRHDRHRYSIGFRFAIVATLVLSQWGKTGPSGQRRSVNQASAAASSENRSTNCASESPSHVVIPTVWRGDVTVLTASDQRKHHAEFRSALRRSPA